MVQREPTTVSSKATTRRPAADRAIVATAHKLLRVVYCVLRTGKPYRDPETDYEAMMVKRNAPRWIRMLEMYNIIEQDGEGRMRAATGGTESTGATGSLSVAT